MLFRWLQEITPYTNTTLQEPPNTSAPAPVPSQPPAHANATRANSPPPAHPSPSHAGSLFQNNVSNRSPSEQQRVSPGSRTNDKRETSPFGGSLAEWRSVSEKRPVQQQQQQLQQQQQQWVVSDESRSGNSTAEQVLVQQQAHGQQQVCTFYLCLTW